MKQVNIVVGVTGSIAVYKACDLVRQLQKQGMNVDVVMTKEAQAFITPLTFQSLANGSVYTDMFATPDRHDIEHIALAKKAQVIVVAPATANCIGKIANGIYDDLLTCVIAASRAAVIFAPAMNTGMYSNRVVQDNIKKLKSLGVRFVGPRTGELACAEKGQGCLEEIEEIVRSVQAAVRSLKR